METSAEQLELCLGHRPLAKCRALSHETDTLCRHVSADSRLSLCFGDRVCLTLLLFSNELRILKWKISEKVKDQQYLLSRKVSKLKSKDIGRS